jgi:hypothetical protein
MPSSRKDDRRNAWRGTVETGRPSIPKGIAQDAGGLRASQAPAADPIAAASHIISAFIQRGGHHAGETGSLREELIGAWELVSYVVREVAAGEELYPFGDTAGLIMYPDGFVSAQMMGRGRPSSPPVAVSMPQMTNCVPQPAATSRTAGRSTWTRRAPSPTRYGVSLYPN